MQTVANIPSETLSPEASDKIAAVGERLCIIAALLRQNDLRGVAALMALMDYHG